MTATTRHTVRRDDSRSSESASEEVKTRKEHAMTRFIRRVGLVRTVFVVAAVLAAVLAATAGPAAADYGTGVYRQIELSNNVPGTQGGGVWLWIELNSNGTGDYAGSDCGHGGVGAASDKGDVTWQPAGDMIVISGVVLNGLPTDPQHGDFSPWHTTITVPAKTGHYSTSGVGAYLTLPNFVPASEGFTQIQVAP